MEDFNQPLVSYLEGTIAYQEAEHIVRTNSDGNIWLIGGSVYRSLAHLLYGAPKPIVDWILL